MYGQSQNGCKSTEWLTIEALHKYLFWIIITMCVWCVFARGKVRTSHIPGWISTREKNAMCIWCLALFTSIFLSFCFVLLCIVWIVYSYLWNYNKAIESMSSRVGTLSTMTSIESIIEDDAMHTRTHARTHNGMLNEQHVKYATVCALWLSRCKLCCFSSSRSLSLILFHFVCRPLDESRMILHFIYHWNYSVSHLLFDESVRVV